MPRQKLDKLKTPIVTWNTRDPLSEATVGKEQKPITKRYWDTEVDIREGEELLLINNNTEVFLSVPLYPDKNTLKHLLKTLERSLNKKMKKKSVTKRNNENFHNKILAYAIGFRHDNHREEFLEKYSEGKLTPLDMQGDHVHFGGFYRTEISGKSYIGVILDS